MDSRRSHMDSAQGGKLKKGPWSFDEDIRLLRYIRLHGDRRWSALAKAAGLQRCGKSCRLRWVNYLHPDLKRGNITEEEERVIIDLHARWGNRWSLIASKIQGRTDNQIKNYWRSRLRKKIQPPPENNYQSTVCQRTSRRCSTPKYSSVLLPAVPLEQTTLETHEQHSVYSTVHPSLGENEKTYIDRGDVVIMKLDIPPASFSLPHEFMANAGMDSSRITSEDTNMNKSSYIDDLQEQVSQLSSTLPICNDPEINGVQNEQLMGGIDLPLYGFPSLEPDELSDILYQYNSGIPPELDDIIAAAALQVPATILGHVAMITPHQAYPVLPYHRAYGTDLCLDFASADVTL